MRRILLSLCLAATVGGGLAWAQPGGGGEAAELRRAKAEAEEATRRSEELERQAAGATDAAARARAEAEALAARIEAAEAEITAAETRVRMIEALQAEQRARLAERQAPVVRLTAALQTMARRPPALALVQPGSIEDVVHVRSLLASTLPVIEKRTEALRREVAAGNRLAEQARVAYAALVDSRATLQQRRADLARLEATQRERSRDLAESALFESDRALALGEEARALDRLVRTREFQARLAGQLAELPGPLPRPGDPPPRAEQGPRYLLPVEGRLVAGVGEISDAGVHSRGLTFETAPGARVVAPAAGRIAYAGAFRGYGQVVIIDHGRGYATVLTDLGESEVVAGQTVGRGAPLGRAAGEGRPRVSLELRRGGRPVPVAALVERS
ncbi:MAG: murein hydrolase activator EnvC family protein [Allosphingosinicella sp.]|uniref:murein hydrolase activator EnvC family protein n=1 Tax=Allosphingosinicella sp. TaxID=2823234 RepID=UPI0039316CE1